MQLSSVSEGWVCTSAEQAFQPIEPKARRCSVKDVTGKRDAMGKELSKRREQGTEAPLQNVRDIVVVWCRVYAEIAKVHADEKLNEKKKKRKKKKKKRETKRVSRVVNP